MPLPACALSATATASDPALRCAGLAAHLSDRIALQCLQDYGRFSNNCDLSMTFGRMLSAENQANVLYLQNNKLMPHTYHKHIANHTCDQSGHNCRPRTELWPPEMYSSKYSREIGSPPL